MIGGLLTLGTVEPWMSGMGGGGYMTIYIAKTDEVKVVEFGMRAPFNSIPEDYPLAAEGSNASDAFNWPRSLTIPTSMVRLQWPYRGT